MITTSKLTKSYRKKDVLKGVDLEAERGRIVGIFGANGSGKTTFLKCAAGLASFGGELLIDGRSPVKDCSVLKEVGVMIDVPSFYKDMTGRENLKFFCNDLSSAEQYIKILGVEDFIDKRVRTYSAGMRQKLGILTACVKGKKLVLLDEPFNGLDVLSLDKADELLDTCRKSGACLILTSHMLEHSGALCDRYYLLKDGKVFKNEDLEKFGKRLYRVEMKDADCADAIVRKFESNVCDKSAKTFEVAFENEDERLKFLNAILGCDFLSVKETTDTVEGKYRIMERKDEAR